MQTFAQKQNQPQKPVSSSLARPKMATLILGHRADLILHLQRTIGNQAVQRLLQANAEEFEVGSTTTASPRFGYDFSRIPIHPPAAGVIQTKLAISKPGDEYEQEADRVADRLMASPALPAVSGAPPRIQHFSRQSNGQIDAAPASVDRVLTSSGRPLDPAIRQDMEQRFGHDFSRVRVHSGAAAEQSAQNVNAHAYTVGYNMVFGVGQFAPETHQGRRLIAHELAHVMQQQTSPAAIQRQPKGKGTPQPAASAWSVPPSPVPLHSDLDEQIAIISETMIPYEIWHRLENVGLSSSQEEDILVKRKLEAIAKLGGLRDERAVITLIGVLEDTVFGVKRLQPKNKAVLQEEAVEALGKIGGQAALSKLHDLLNSQDPKQRALATRGFSGSSGGQAATDLLARLKQEKAANIKFEIITDLGKIGAGLSSNQEKEAIAKALINEMENNTGDVFRASITALGRLRLKSATDALLKQLKLWLSIPAITGDIIRALGEIGDDRAVDDLVIMLEKHGSKFVRSQAAIALGKIGGSKALAALKRRLNQESEDSVKADISKAIHGTPAILHWTFGSVRLLP
jgi:HEAT repeat protein